MFLRDFCDGMQKRLDDRIQELRVHMGGGGCSDFEDYKKNVGQIAAFTECKTMIEEGKTQYVEDDDE